MLVIDKVGLAVMQKVHSIILTADQVSFGYRHMPQSHNCLQTITIILHRGGVEDTRLEAKAKDTKKL